MRATSRARLVAAAAAVLAAGAVASADVAASYPSRHGAADTTHRHVVFSISSPLVTESSSLAVSTTHPGLVYTTNDSGDEATVYVLDATNGDLVGQASLTGVVAVDIEALAIGSDGTLVVGDIGDNHTERDSVHVYRFAQPGRGETSVRPEAVTLTYSDGPRDAESLLYDSEAGRVFIASKLLGGAKIYGSPTAVFDRSHAAMTPIGVAAPPIATDATFVRDQNFAVIRTYFNAAVYSYPAWHRVVSFDLPSQPQGESVAAPVGGKTLWIGSEGAGSKVLGVRLPALEPTSSTAPTRTPTTTVTRTETTPVESPHGPRLTVIAWLVLVTSAVLLLLVVIVGLVLHRRGRASSSA